LVPHTGRGSADGSAAASRAGSPAAPRRYRYHTCGRTERPSKTPWEGNMKTKSKHRLSALSGAIAVSILTITAGAPALAQDADPEATTTDPATELEVVVVRGVRGAQAEAIETKRNAAQILDSISAEDIGKLPDVTIADSLQRITGVQIRRSAGEGALVNIRGVPQVQTTLNGELFLGAGGGDQYGQPNLGRAQPDFVDIPPTLFRGVDVVKSLTASDLDGGIGGTIALRTHRPFDFQAGWTFSAQAEANYGSIVKELNEQYSALANYRSDRWGALLAVSYSDASLANKRPSVWSNGAQKSSESDVGFDFNGDGVIGGNFDPDNVPREYFYNWVATELENRYTERQRLGVNAAIQFDFTDSVRLNADVAYTDMDNLDKSVAAQLHTSWATNQLQPGSIVDPNGVLEYGIFNY